MPVLVEYGCEFKGEVARELLVLPPGSATEAMLDDYATLRRQTRRAAGVDPDAIDGPPCDWADEHD